MIIRTRLGLLAAAAALPLFACGLGQPARAQAQAYDIEPEDLTRAIVALAVRSRRNIVFAAHLLDGKRAARVDGAPSFAQALRLVLKGTGLEATLQPDGSVTLAAIPARVDATPAAPRSAPPARLPAPPTTVAQVVVVAGRSLAFASAVRTDPSLVVVSGADIEGGPDRNAAEALGRIVGVTVLDSGPPATNSVAVDFAARGEGNYTSLRGLDAEFNVSLINGVDVAQSQPYSRGVQLNLLPTTACRSSSS